MPCYDGRDDDPRYNGIDDARKQGQTEARADCRHNSDVAELLCWVMHSLNVEQSSSRRNHNPALNKWWKEHQECDKRKKVR